MEKSVVLIAEEEDDGKQREGKNPLQVFLTYFSIISSKRKSIFSIPFLQSYAHFFLVIPTS